MDYNRTGLTRTELEALRRKLRIPARELIRERGANQAGLNRDELSEEQAFEALIENPNLMQRPIVVQGNLGLVARPVEALRAFLDPGEDRASRD